MVNDLKDSPATGNPSQAHTRTNDGLLRQYFPRKRKLNRKIGMDIIISGIFLSQLKRRKGSPVIYER
ncbi:MAG: hypothetical protein K8S15_08575 [Candidatus Aegiribacteria sp.]|nr:hypothetical protein [Candidatus Aegiribacteria sp.]